VCRSVVADWTSSHTPLALDARFALAPGGIAQLALTRIATDASPPYVMHLVAEVDGPVRNAVARVVRAGEDPGNPGCYLGTSAIGGGKYVFRVVGHDTSGKRSASKHEGVLGGDVGDLPPRVLAHRTDGRHFGWVVGARWLVRLDSGLRLAARAWGEGDDAWMNVDGPELGTLMPGRPVVSGAAIFFPVMSGARVGLVVWDAEHGSRPLLGWIGDGTRAAGDLGTDGKDLVWSYGELKGTGKPPSRSLMTAAFTTDAASLQPRRVRSDPGTGIEGNAWVVGCGMAAHTSGGGGITVVRLADGRSWSVPGRSSNFALEAPIGLTCDEVFAPGLLNGRTSIAAVRIQSLPP